MLPMHNLFPTPNESNQPPKPQKGCSHLFETRFQLPTIGLSLEPETETATATARDFDLFDENVGYSTRHTNPVAEHQTVTFKRIGLHDTHHAIDGIHSGELGYEGIMNAYEKLSMVASEQPPIVLLLDGCATLSRPDLNNDLHFSVAMEGGLNALQELKASGNIAAFGLVSDYAEYCQRALRAGEWDLFVLNHRYTLLEQWPLFNLLPECEETSTAVIVGHPFNSGVLRGEPSWNFARPPAFVKARIDTIEHICALHEVPIPAAALQFPLAHKMVPSVLVNARTEKTQRQVKRWLQHPIANSFWDDLKLGGVMHEEAPTPVFYPPLQACS